MGVFSFHSLVNSINLKAIFNTTDSKMAANSATVAQLQK